MSKEIVLYSGPKEKLRLVKRLLEPSFRVEWCAPDTGLLKTFTRCSIFLDASLKVRIDKGAIGKAKKLKLVITATTGADHIDAAALAARKIPLFTLKDQKKFLRNITPAAEHSWLLLMACARKLKTAMEHVQNGGWDRTQFPGVLLKNKTLGIIGFGRIGSRMARYAHAFDMDVIVNDPYNKKLPTGVVNVSVKELLSRSDFISIHVHLTEETKKLLNAENVTCIKPGAILINTSRGEILDDRAVIACLKSWRLAAVGVDVLTGEPDVKKNPLWQRAQKDQRIIITPHIAGFAQEALNQVLEFTCGRILEFFRL